MDDIKNGINLCYLNVITKHYVDFDGRATRKEFWMFELINFLVYIIVGVLGLLHLGFLGIIYMLGIFLPSLAITVRRLHDTNRSGWWVLINLIPLIGTVWLFILLILPTEGSSDNKTETNNVKGL